MERHVVKAFIEERLAQIAATPDLWGGLEAIEFQLLQLLELEAALDNRSDERDVLEAWQRHVREKYPGAGPVYLCAVVKDAKAVVDEVLEFRQHRSLAPVFPLFDRAPGRGLRNGTRG